MSNPLPETEKKCEPFPTAKFINLGAACCFSIGLLVASIAVPWDRWLVCANASLTAFLGVMSVATWNLYGSRAAREKAMIMPKDDRPLNMFLAGLGGIVGAGAAAIVAAFF